MEGKQIVNLQRNDDIISLFVRGVEGTEKKMKKRAIGRKMANSSIYINKRERQSHKNF